MMKHVQLSPFRGRADTVSLSSTTSYGSLSPEPLGSRSSSYSSLNEPSQLQSTIKVYAKCLRPDIEYKTLSIGYQTTCREVVSTLLSKYKMKHRDPKLFYLCMEVTVRKAGVKTQLTLDENARPAVLQSCHPKGDSKFSLQTVRGGLVKVYDSALNANSQYKSLLISARTTVDDLLTLLLTCSNSNERVEQFSLYEVCTDREQQRKLHPDDRPLHVQALWAPGFMKCHFLIRRNPDYIPLSRRKCYWINPLPPLQQSRIANYHQSQLSKSQSSLLHNRKIDIPKPIENNNNNNKKTSAISNNKGNVSSNANSASVVSNITNHKSQVELTKFRNLNNANPSNGSQPPYADYENYFYI